MIRRNITDSLLEALRDRPVVLLNGARQTGKTTLVRSLGSGYRAAYYTLDEAPVLTAVSSDPAGFLSGVEGPVIIDEIQRAPALLLAIKAAVDRERRPGRFLLTGSADVLSLPKVADALPGRMEIFTLWPLSQGEIEGVREPFLEWLFSAALPTTTRLAVPFRDLAGRMVRGGYPEIQILASDARRDAWFASYVTAVLQRDVRDQSAIASLSELPRLLSLLAARGASVLNTAELSRSSGVPWQTLKRYLALLERSYLIQKLPAWLSNRGQRLVKAEKLIMVDTGLMTHLLGVDADRLVADQGPLGGVLENFVIMEVIRQVSWSTVRPRAFHFRTHVGREVDLVLEDRRGRVVGIEVKRASSVDKADFKGLEALREEAGRHFWRGVLLYGGDQAVPFGERLHALPIPALWHSVRRRR